MPPRKSKPPQRSILNMLGLPEPEHKVESPPPARKTRRVGGKKPAAKGGKRKCDSDSESVLSPSESRSPRSPRPLLLSAKARPLKEGVQVTQENCSTMFRINYADLEVETRKRKYGEDGSARGTRTAEADALRRVLRMQRGMQKATPSTYDQTLNRDISDLCAPIQPAQKKGVVCIPETLDSDESGSDESVFAEFGRMTQHTQQMVMSGGATQVMKQDSLSSVTVSQKPLALKCQKPVDAVRTIIQHTLRARGLMETIIDTAQQATESSPLQKGSHARRAVLSLVQRVFVSCLLKKLGLTYQQYSANVEQAKDAKEPSVPWSVLYSPSSSHEAVSPCPLVSTAPPSALIRAYLVNWRNHLVPDDKKVLGTISTMSASVVLLCGAIAAGVVDWYTSSVMVLQKVGRRYIEFKPRLKKKRGRPNTGKKKPPSTAQAERKARNSYHKDKDSIESFSDTEESTEDAMEDDIEAGLIVYGKKGVGKTAAIYAAASEAGYTVVEINCSKRRTRDSLFSAFRDAVQCRLVDATNDSPVPTVETVIVDDDGDDESPSQWRRKRKIRSSPSASPPKKKSLLNSKPIISTPKAARSESRGDSILILFEGPDTVFDDEVGFYSAVRSLITEAKCPIILSCSALTQGLRDLRCPVVQFNVGCSKLQNLPNVGSYPDLDPNVWPGFPPSSHSVPTLGLGISVMIQIILLAEGYKIASPQVRSLILSYGTDIRAMVNACQMWFQGTAVPMIHQISNNAEVLIPVEATVRQVASASVGVQWGCSNALGDMIEGFGTPNGSSYLTGSTMLTNAGDIACGEVIMNNYLRCLTEDTLAPKVPLCHDGFLTPPKAGFNRTLSNCSDASEILFPNAIEKAGSPGETSEEPTPTVGVRHGARVHPVKIGLTTDCENIKVCSQTAVFYSFCDTWRTGYMQSQFEDLTNEGLVQEDDIRDGAWWRRDALNIDWLCNNMMANSLKALLRAPNALSRSDVAAMFRSPGLLSFSDAFCKSVWRTAVISHPNTHIELQVRNSVKFFNGRFFFPAHAERKKEAHHRLQALISYPDRHFFMTTAILIYASALRENVSKTLNRLRSFIPEEEWTVILGNPCTHRLKKVNRE
eukprot:TRINITY_DN5972_c1_g1_i1.p1 TRINITY_DN5972_c1_g1~~TRINITY_DN5972_c1_g1_i1.p1  ORF type:complete len:1101 (+),score=119.85 TRINITY_DN5972_c1_g1_i1:72-3374(+)